MEDAKFSVTKKGEELSVEIVGSAVNIISMVFSTLEDLSERDEYVKEVIGFSCKTLTDNLKESEPVNMTRADGTKREF